MTPRIRRAGARWRLLVHNMLPGGGVGAAHHVKSHADEGRLPRGVLDGEARRRVDRVAATYGVTTLVPGTEFDELVVGHWLHVEQMGGGHYWMSIGGVHVNVVADRDGHARSVHVDLADPREGVRYRLPPALDG